MRRALRVHPGSTPGSMPSASRNWINCLRRAVRIIGCSMKDLCPCLPIIGLHVAMWSMSGMLTETSRITSGYSLIHSRSRMNGFEDIRQRLKQLRRPDGRLLLVHVLTETPLNYMRLFTSGPYSERFNPFEIQKNMWSSPNRRAWKP